MPKATISDRTRLMARDGHSLHFGQSAPPTASQASVPRVVIETQLCSNGAWGLWLFPLALLIYKSRFLPRFLGVWLALAGFAWVVLSLTSTRLPQYQDRVNSYLQPAIIGEIVFML